MYQYMHYYYAIKVYAVYALYVFGPHLYVRNRNRLRKKHTVYAPHVFLRTKTYIFKGYIV